MKKIFEHYAIKRNIDEIKVLFYNTVKKYNKNIIENSSKIKDNGYVCLEENLFLTMPNKEEKEVNCCFNFFDFTRMIELKDIVKSNIDGDFFVLDNKIYIQVNIPVLLFNILDGLFLFIDNEKYLRTLNHECIHAYNYFLEKEDKYINDLQSTYQDKLLSKNDEDMTAFYNMVYWLWDKDEFNAWLLSDTGTDKEFFNKKEEYLNKLKKNNSPSF